MTNRIAIHELDYAPAATTETLLVPLTTVLNGEPTHVWDADNNQVMVEVPR